MWQKSTVRLVVGSQRHPADRKFRMFSLFVWTDSSAVLKLIAPWSFMFCRQVPEGSFSYYLRKHFFHCRCSQGGLYLSWVLHQALEPHLSKIKPAYSLLNLLPPGTSSLWDGGLWQTLTLLLTIQEEQRFSLFLYNSRFLLMKEYTAINTISWLLYSRGTLFSANSWEHDNCILVAAWAEEKCLIIARCLI